MKRVIALSLSLGWVLLMGLQTRPSRAFGGDAVTFNNQVVRLLQRKCQVCHHPDDIGPFSFMTYSEAKLFSVIMSQAAASREMPPWSAAPDCGEFANEPRLTGEEIRRIRNRRGRTFHIKVKRMRSTNNVRKPCPRTCQDLPTLRSMAVDGAPLKTCSAYLEMN